MTFWVDGERLRRDPAFVSWVMKLQRGGAAMEARISFPASPCTSATVTSRACRSVPSSTLTGTNVTGSPAVPARVAVDGSTRITDVETRTRKTSRRTRSLPC